MRDLGFAQGRRRNSMWQPEGSPLATTSSDARSICKSRRASSAVTCPQCYSGYPSKPLSDNHGCG